MKMRDYAMHCCGIVTACDIAEGVGLSEMVDHVYFGRSMKSSDADWDKHFAKITEHQRKHRRNCGIMVLSSAQITAKKHAERNGWEVVTEFYNPNSGNECYVMTKLLWPSSEAYNEAVDSGEYEKPERDAWQDCHNEEFHLEEYN